MKNPFDQEDRGRPRTPMNKLVDYMKRNPRDVVVVETDSKGTGGKLAEIYRPKDKSTRTASRR